MKFLFYFLFSINVVFAQDRKIERPKVIIGVVVDQMRWDFLYRYYDRYSSNGFKKLMRHGFSFENTSIPYNPTLTAPGHAAIYTGSVPSINGIVGNDWFDNTKQVSVYCTSDKTVRTIGSTSKFGQMSPANLNATTIGDELRLSTNFRSRVFGVSLKDRGAILPAGRSANAAFWLDDSSGKWISSSWYMQELPGWLVEYNARRIPDSLMALDWNPLYPISSYSNSTPDSSSNEKSMLHENRITFPHVYRHQIGKNYNSLRVSPSGNWYTLQLAKQLIENERPGMDGTDMVCLSFSATDYIGHRFGVNSAEIEDTYLRLDLDIAELISFLEKKYGNEYLLFLTADHGAAQSPAFLKDHSLLAGSLNTWVMAAELNGLLQNYFKAGNLVDTVINSQVYLNHSVIDSLKQNEGAIKRILIDYIEQKPEVFHCLDNDQLIHSNLPAFMKNAFQLGYNRERSGDLQIVLRPQFADHNDLGTEHGSVFNYDTRIPLIFYGWRIMPGETFRETSITDIAPSLAALLHIQAPNGSIGKVLLELFGSSK